LKCITLHIISVCDCDSQGSIGVSCDNDGKCKCKPNFTGTRCDKCKEGLYNFPICEGKILIVCTCPYLIHILTWNIYFCNICFYRV